MTRVFPALLLALVAAWAHAYLPPRSIGLPESQVKDVFFGYIVGILVNDVPLDGDGESFMAMFPEFEDGGAQVPFNEMERVARIPHVGGAQVIVQLKHELDYPVPVDILGYHPGRVTSSQRLVFDESPFFPPDPAFGIVRIERLREGSLGIDFVNWLDILLGSWVDDVSAELIVVAQYERQWYILLGGATPQGGWITGVYDLQSSRIVVRPAAALRALGANLAMSRR